MDPIEYLKTVTPLAHAYVVRGNVSELFSPLKRVFGERAGGKVSPDLWTRSFETLTVDDARQVASFAYLRPVHDKKYIVLACKSLTDEAQHALLKIVEDGVGHSTFILLVPQGAYILPTLLSRCVIIKASFGGAENEDEVQAFISLSYAERLTRVEAFAKDHDRESARTLVRGLLGLARKRGYGSAILRDLLEADQYLAGSGSSIKSVVGHLALTLPVA